MTTAPIAQHRRATNPTPATAPMTGPNVFTIQICSDCGYPPGDGCDCRYDLADTMRAFAPAGSRPGAYGPIVLDLTGGAR